MIKIVGNIVDSNRLIIGFVMRGKMSEFGEVGEEVVSRVMRLDALKAKRFTNRQVRITQENGVEESKNFRLNELPMYRVEGRELKSVNHLIALTHRVLKYGETVGFGVQFGDGETGVYRYIDLIRLCKWYKPENFMVKTSASNKVFISGKPNGIKVNDLPIFDVTPRATKKQKDEYQKNVNREVDIIDIFDIVNGVGGAILNMPYTKYTPKNEAVYKESEEFNRLGYGEVAYPNIGFNDTKLNLNANFKQPGIVYVNINGVETPVYTFIYKTRTIFSGADSFMGQIGFAVGADKEDEISELFKNLGGVTKITDPKIAKSVSSLLGGKDSKIFVVNNQKINAMSSDKIAKSVLGVDKLDSLTRKYFIARAIVKYIGNGANGVIGQLKKSGIVQDEKTREIYKLFRGYNRDALEALEVAGINIYDGNFTKVSKVEKDPMDEMFESVKDVADKNEDISIEYFINGFEIKKWTGKAILEDVSSGAHTLPKEVIDAVQMLEGMADSVEKLQAAIELKDKYTKIVNKLKRIYWMHSASMLIKTNKESVHSHDKDLWVEDLKKKGKASQFICTAKGYEDIRVVMTGITIE